MTGLATFRSLRVFNYRVWALGSEARGRGFETGRARQLSSR